LFQTKDKTLFDIWNIKTKNRPGQVFVDQMAFGTILAMGSRSYSSILLKNNSVVGISQACKSPQRSVDVALTEAQLFKEHNPPSAGAENQIIDSCLADVLVCDAPIHLCDSLKTLTDAGLKAIIEPGGSKQDDELVDYCNEHFISLIFTGMSHISH
jgi:AICAR transformylase/IMP cyclohydrolase PurH